MSYTFVPVPTISTGDAWTAANHNTYIKDNFAGAVPGAFLSKGDLYVGVAGTDVGQILPAGANGAKLHALNAEATGLIWMKDAPGAEIFAAAAQSIPNTVLTTVTFDTEVWDVGGYSASGAGPIVIPLGHFGLYLCSAYFYFDGHATPNKFREITINIAGTSPQTFVNTGTNGVNGVATWLVVTAIAYLLPNNTITVLAQQVSGGALNIYQKRLSVVKIT